LDFCIPQLLAQQPEWTAARRPISRYKIGFSCLTAFVTGVVIATATLLI
jgi:hypothetical protein